MITHPLLEPKQKGLEQRVANLANDFVVREPKELVAEPARHNRRWLGVLGVYGLIAILAFMLVPVVSLTFGESTTNFLESIEIG